MLIVDDHVMFLQGVSHLLPLLSPSLQIDTAHALADALQWTRLQCYEVILLDWGLAERDGSLGMDELRDTCGKARILALADDADPALMRRAIHLGAAGCIPKHFSAEMMLGAIEQVRNGRVFVPTDMRAGGASHEALTQAGLTARQTDVYLAAAKGWPNKVIARELGIAESTVKTHLTAVYAALGVRNRAEAAYQAARNGWMGSLAL